MSGQYRRTYPNKGFIFLDGGLNSKYERSLISDEESPSCQNVIFNNGAVETRQGIAKLNTTSVGSFVGDGIYTRRAANGAETMVAWWNGGMQAFNGVSFATVPSAQSVFTAGVRVGSAQDEGYIFMGNGGSIPYKYNGTDFTRHGVYPPTTTSTVASITTSVGVLTGDYRYKMTWVNSSLVQGDVGPVTATFTAAAAKLYITSLPIAPQSYGISTRKLYRTVAGGTTFMVVATIADNTTTEYVDNNADSTLGATAPTDNGVPPKWNAIVYHPSLGRLFMNDPDNPNYVWWTEANQPYTVKTTNFVRIGDNTSDLVKGFAIQDNALVVFCENSISIGYFPSNTDSEWKWITSRSSVGSKSPYCLLRYEDRILFPAVQNGVLVGFADFVGDDVAASSTLLTISTVGSELQSDKIEPDVFQMQSAYVSNISGIVYKNKAYIAVTYGSGQTQNNRYYVYDFSISRLSSLKKPSWVPNTGCYPAQFAIYSGNLYFQSSQAVGRVYQMNSGTYSDDGSAIDSYYWTKEYPGFQNEVNFNKDFRYANVMVETSGNYRMTLAYRVDSDSGDGDVQQINLNPGGSLWGTMIWGTDTWGGGSAQKEVRQFLGTARGKRIQFKFSNQNTAGQKFKCYRLNFAYNIKGYR